MSVATLIGAREGHFLLESGHHGSLWLDLDALFVRPAAVEPFATRLAERIAAYDVDVVCGPYSGGAFLAQTIAARLDTQFAYSEPAGTTGGLYGRSYSIPKAFALENRRVAVVDDVINAASAVTATIAALEARGARTTVVASLMVLGEVGRQRLTPYRVETLEARRSGTWEPDSCPLCAQGVSLTSQGVSPTSQGVSPTS